jgi:hypothetical protein
VGLLESLHGEQRLKERVQPSADDREWKRSALGRCTHTHQSPTSYLVTVTDFTEIVSPLAVPVTLASSQANLLSVSNAA